MDGAQALQILQENEWEKLDHKPLCAMLKSHEMFKSIVLAQSLKDTRRNVRNFISVIESFTSAKMAHTTSPSGSKEGGVKSPTIMLQLDKVEEKEVIVSKGLQVDKICVSQIDTLNCSLNFTSWPPIKLSEYHKDVGKYADNHLYGRDSPATLGRLKTTSSFEVNNKAITVTPPSAKDDIFLLDRVRPPWERRMKNVLTHLYNQGIIKPSDQYVRVYVDDLLHVADRDSRQTDHGPWIYMDFRRLGHNSLHLQSSKSLDLQKG